MDVAITVDDIPANGKLPATEQTERLLRIKC